MKKQIVLFLLLILSAFSFAQKNRVPSKCPKTQLKIGDKFYGESYFYTAAEYYKDVVRQDSSNRYANFWLAMSLLNARDYENSEVFHEFWRFSPPRYFCGAVTLRPTIADGLPFHFSKI